MLLKITNLKKYHDGRLILDIPSLSLYESDRIGLIGPNGGGKTSLLNLIAGRDVPDEGSISAPLSTAYLEQFAPDDSEATLSGGERRLEQIGQILGQNPALLLADEPDCHLDIKARDYLTKKLTTFKGGFILVSHDRDFLESQCHKILALESGRVRLFPGSYSAYLQQKDLEEKSAESIYENYDKERKRLKRAMRQAETKSRSVKKAPSRMGNSEARLHKMGDQRAKGSWDKAKERLKSSLDHLTKAPKPIKKRTLKIEFAPEDLPGQAVAIEGHDLHKSYGDQVIFDGAAFSLSQGAVCALVGPNGCGKSTLLNMIQERAVGISWASRVKLGFLKQHFENLDSNASVLDNVNEVSIHPESFNRVVLGGLMFVKDAVHKKCSILSGGEKNKLSLARLILSQANVLMLDEPTNFMDIASIEAVEQALAAYQGTILFTSHDRHFIRAAASEVWLIEDRQIKVCAPEDI